LTTRPNVPSHRAGSEHHRLKKTGARQIGGATRNRPGAGASAGVRRAGPGPRPAGPDRSNMASIRVTILQHGRTSSTIQKTSVAPRPGAVKMPPSSRGPNAGAPTNRCGSSDTPTPACRTGRVAAARSAPSSLTRSGTRGRTRAARGRRASRAPTSSTCHEDALCLLAGALAGGARQFLLRSPPPVSGGCGQPQQAADQAVMNRTD